MSKRENIIPFAPLGDIIAQASGKRVTKQAKQTAAQMLEDLTEKIVKKALLLAENDKRKTIKEKDIVLASKQIRGGY